MAQKQPADQSRRWLGLTGSAVLLANLVLTGTSIAFQQEGEVNHALGIEGSNASYGGTEFSADGSLTDTSYAAYIQAAYEFCEQEEEEGSVLLYNRNNALPLSESERNVTAFGRGSIDPVFRSTAGGSSTNKEYQQTPVDALQGAGFNVNQTVLDAYANAPAPEARSVSSVGEYDPALFTGSVTDSFAS
jgi:beta-glucosidase